MDNLLGRTVVAEDLAAGIAIQRAGRYQFRLVTLEGDVMHSGGSDDRRQRAVAHDAACFPARAKSKRTEQALQTALRRNSLARPAKATPGIEEERVVRSSSASRGELLRRAASSGS